MGYFDAEIFRCGSFFGKKIFSRYGLAREEVMRDGKK